MVMVSVPRPVGQTFQGNPFEGMAVGQGGKGQPMTAGKGGSFGGGSPLAGLAMQGLRGGGRGGGRRQRRMARRQDEQLQAIMNLINPPVQFPRQFGGGR